MKVAVFVVGCVLALPSGVGVGLCSVAAWLLQHPPPHSTAYNPPRATYTALGMLVVLVLVVLLGVAANLLMGIGAHGQGAQGERSP